MLRSRWSLGLVPLAVLFLAALTIETPRVESDLAARAGAVVQAAGGSAVVTGRDVALSLPAASDAERAVGAVLALPGVRLVSGLEIAPAPVPAPVPTPPPALPAAPAPAPIPAPAPVAAPVVAQAPALPVVKPFTLTIERMAAGLVASGYAPGAEDRDAFMAALQTAAAPGLVTGSLALADGLAPGVEFQRAAQFVAVQASRLVSGRAGFSDDQFFIAGETADTAALAALRAAIGGVLPGGLKLAAQEVQALPPPPPPLSPYVFSAERAGNGLVLSGAAPSAEARALLLDLAGFAGREVVDRVIIAPGEPVGFATFAAHGVSQAARLSTGRFTLTDSSYALEGEAADFDAYNAVRQDLRTAPQGVTLVRIDVKPPALKRYPFSVSREGGAIVLRGAFPDDAARDAAIALARNLFPGLEVRSEALIARGAPDAFGEIVRAALNALARLGQGGGSVAFTGGVLSLEGAASGSADELAAALQSLLPGGVSLDLSGLRVPAPVPAPVAVAERGGASGAALSCTPDASGIVAQARIYFDSARGRPQPQFDAEVDRLARLMLACGGATALVTGHTDGAGNRAPNLELSGVRAGMVARRLREAGVPAQRIDTLAYAWDRPAVSPEADARDRAQNRRVEIIIRAGSR